MMAARRAETHADFALSLLRPPMRVLDIGCGPGSITIGLAAQVAPTGVVYGIDPEPSQMLAAKSAGAAAGVQNAVFLIGTVYDLGFADATIDAVFAHGLFEHLS